MSKGIAKYFKKILKVSARIEVVDSSAEKLKKVKTIQERTPKKAPITNAAKL